MLVDATSGTQVSRQTFSDVRDADAFGDRTRRAQRKSS